MPIGGLLEPVVSAALEFVGEILIKGVGYVLVKYVWYSGRKSPYLDGAACLIVGVLFWAAVVGASFLVYLHLHP